MRNATPAVNPLMFDQARIGKELNHGPVRWRDRVGDPLPAVPELPVHADERWWSFV